MKTLPAISVCLVLSALCLGAGAAENSAPALPKELSSYTSWKRVNPKPLRLPDPTAQLCRNPTPDDYNPHRHYWFTVRVNPKGEKAMAKPKAPLFPTGTLIVKEKLATKSATEPVLLTVMVKRGKGFDKQTGDWEYLTVDDKGEVTLGKEQTAHCRSCHEKAKDNDYVFRTYLPKTAVKKAAL